VIKIVVLPMYGIGDVLMTTPALRNIKEHLDAEITFIHMFKTTADILSGNPHVDMNLHFPFLSESRIRGFRFLTSLRGKYDCSINFYPSNKRDYNLAAFVIGCGERLGHRYAVRDLLELNFLKNRTLKEDNSLHNVEENLRLLSFLSIERPQPYPLKIYLSEEERGFAMNWLRERKLDARILVGVHPGTSSYKNHERRRWPEVSFAGLLDRLSRETDNVSFLLFGGPEEKDLRDRVISLSRYPQNIYPVESVTIRQSASIMAACNIFVSNDSGPMHMAVASGVPTLGVFGPTNPDWVGPWHVNGRVCRLGTDMPCSPCFRYSPRPLECRAKLDYACLARVRVEEVFDGCLSLLKAGNNDEKLRERLLSR